jgi:hypothetical protein
MEELIASFQKRDFRQVGPTDQVNSIYDQLNRIKQTKMYIAWYASYSQSALSFWNDQATDIRRRDS